MDQVNDGRLPAGSPVEVRYPAPSRRRKGGPSACSWLCGPGSTAGRWPNLLAQAVRPLAVRHWRG